MKVAPVSADLLIKLALLAGGVLVAAYVVRKASTAASDAAGAAWDATSQAVRDGAWAVTPWNQENVFYEGINNAIWPDGSESLGTWLYNLTHSDPLKPSAYGNALNAWDTSGRWNNPSAYTAPSGQGGAAFGIYPRP